jgi:eukaryotic-like serine/threonine-protein kinase
MRLTPGARLGLYEITAALGAGGMGEVYRATDSRLKRQVALKVLPVALTADPDRLARFQREAEVLASLNHSSIAQIYGVEEADGVRALVMELVEGPTLAERIAEGPIPLDEALPIAHDVAGAIEAAHERGIIHRDLKPANIKVRPDGTVKVLDFGLAKAFEADRSGVGRLNPTESPTLTSPVMVTGMGTILGTAAYMSPEQAKARAVDARADIWAFGCVLYEMLTGRRAFPGDDITETLANVLKSAPDWTALPPPTPPGIRRVLRRCLERDVKERQRSIGDVKLEIADANRYPESAAASASSLAHDAAGSAGGSRALIRTTVVVATVLVAAAGGWLLGRRQTVASSSPAVSRLSIASPPTDPISVSGNTRDLAISPDGRRVAFIGGNGTALMIRDLDRSDPIRIEVAGLPHQPFFSPDGAWVGFMDGLSALRRVPARGGAIETISRIAGVGAHPTWAGDTVVFSTYGELFRVPASGGVPERIATEPGGEPATMFSPSFVRGSNAVLFANGGKKFGIGVLDLGSGKRKILFPGGSGAGARYLTSGHLIYAVASPDRADPTLRIVGFDRARLDTIGAPAAMNEPIFITPFGGIPDFDVSDNGTLVYVAASATPTARRLVWVGRDGREEPIDLPVRAYTYPSIAPGGTQVAFDIRDQENDTWLWNSARQTLTRLTFDRAFNQYAVWTHDARRLVNVVGAEARDGAVGMHIVSQPADGHGKPEVLAQRPHIIAAYGFSPDDRRLVFREDFPETGHDLMLLSLDGGKRSVEPLLQTRFAELNAEISPDGRWLAYESDESGAREIYVRPFPDVTSGRWQISSSGGRMPLWARSGRELFFVAPNGAMMSAVVDTSKGFASQAPTKLFDHRNYIGGASNVGRTYDVSPDGRRFLMIKPDGPPATIVVVLNWFEAVRAAQ